MNLLSLLLFASVLLVFRFGTVQSAPIVSKTDKDLIIDVSPFFKMKLSREPDVTDLRLNILSGLVKVDYDKYPGRKSNVDVQVFGIGSNRRRNRDRPRRPYDDDDDDDDKDSREDEVEPARLSKAPRKRA